MKIIQIVHSLPNYRIAGTEIYTYNLVQELSKRHKIFIFHRINDLGMDEYAITRDSSDNADIISINNTFRYYNSFEMTYRNKAIAERFGMILDEINPDIVHIQHLLYLSAEIIEEIKKRKIPLLFTLHDYWLLCPQGQFLKNNLDICNGENKRECIDCVLYQLSIKKYSFNAYYFLEKIAPKFLFNLIKNIYLKYSKFYFSSNKMAFELLEKRKSYMRDISLKADLFISPSHFLKKKFIEFGIPEKKIIFLRQGLNLSKFKEIKKKSSSRLIFVFIGNILPAKGVHLLIKAFNNLSNEDVELRIYGEEVAYKSILVNYARKIKKMSRNKNVRFMGRFENKDIGKIFREIDVLIVPSIWYENSPLVIQEAFAAGVPVLASRIGGIPELIEDGVNGFLFEPNNVDELEKKINLIIENPSLIEKIKQNIRPPKDIEQNAREIENIYEKLLSRC